MYDLFNNLKQEQHQLFFDPANFKPSEIIPEGNYTLEDAVEVFTKRHIFEGFNAANKKTYASKFNNTRPKEVLKKFNEFGIDAIKDSPQYKLAVEEVNNILNTPGVDYSIPKKYWDKFSNFYGINQSIVCHPHFFQALFNEVQEAKKQKLSDTLVLMACSGKKPYGQNRLFQRFIKPSRETRLFDFAVLSLYPVMITPLNVSYRYPHICYDWPHEDSQALIDFRCLLCAFAVYYMIKELGYKNIINIDWNHNRSKIDYLREIFDINVINFYEHSAYTTIANYMFSDKTIDPVTNTFKQLGSHKGLVKLRYLITPPVAQFMLDLFGPQLEPYFNKIIDKTENSQFTFWEDPNRDAVLKIAKWDTDRVKPLYK